MKALNRYEIFIHLFFWLFLIAALNVIFQVTIVREVNLNGKTEPLSFQVKIFRPLLIGLIFKIGFFYANTEIFLKKSLQSGKYLPYAIGILITGVILFYMEMLVVDYYYYLTHRVTNGSIRNYLLKVDILIYVFIAAVSFLSFFIKRWFSLQKLQAKFREEHLVNQLQVLNYQVNPHFLFNTLNNLYALAEKRENRDLSFGIAKLADIMRYILYDCSKSYVALTKEVIYLQDYIDISRMRVMDEPETLQIDYLIEGEIENLYIAPMLFIPLVENAFKHGIRYHKKSFIDIRLSTEEDLVIFRIRNTKHALVNNKLKKVSSIGLENLRKRLAIVYPSTHELIIEDLENSFSILLKIPVYVN